MTTLICRPIRDGWGGAIHKAFHDISHDPGWTF